MFTNYDYSEYNDKSIVRITFGETITDDSDFNYFLNKWLELYENKKDFIFIFNCENVGYVPIKYSIKMALFIRTLRRKDYQYLQKSIIYIPSPRVKRLLDFIFMIQPPVARVYIINDLKLIDDILLNNIINENIEIIEPGNSFLNLL
jgi:hypothetical protein